MMGWIVVVLKLSGLDYIIRLDAADERFPGGWSALISENFQKIGRLAFFDDDLIILHTTVGAQPGHLLSLRGTSSP
jgi:hypothetical protein